MKMNKIFPAVLMLFLLAFIILPVKHILAQNQLPGTASQQLPETSFVISHHLPKPEFDIPKVNLNQFGKGLQYYNVMVLKKPGMVNTHIRQTGIKSEMGKKAISDSEMDNLRQNVLFIDKKCESLMKKWVRDERWDLNLEEVIRGFYTKPVF